MLNDGYENKKIILTKQLITHFLSIQIVRLQSAESHFMMSRYSEVVPPAVITFLKEFAASIESGNLQDIMENYGEKWEDINKLYHRTTSWPSAKTIQAQLQRKHQQLQNCKEICAKNKKSQNHSQVVIF